MTIILIILVAWFLIVGIATNFGKKKELPASKRRLVGHIRWTPSFLDATEGR